MKSYTPGHNELECHSGIRHRPACGGESRNFVGRIVLALARLIRHKNVAVIFLSDEPALRNHPTYGWSCFSVVVAVGCYNEIGPVTI